MNAGNLLQSTSPHVLFPTGAILLDVENFPLKIDLAQQLQSYCQYSFTIKFAVAHWQNSNISKLDKYLHLQGYQLIHVPKEKNGADAQILTIGASLLSYYPQVREVAIASGDSIFNYLHQTLQRQGCQTYKVYQQSGKVYVHNLQSDRTSTISDFSKNKHNQKPTIEELLKDKIVLSLKKLVPESNEAVPLSQVSQQFKLDYQQSIAEAVKTNKIAKSASGFIKKSCLDKMKIHQKGKIYYLSIKSE